MTIIAKLTTQERDQKIADDARDALVELSGAFGVQTSAIPAKRISKAMDAIERILKAVTTTENEGNFPP